MDKMKKMNPELISMIIFCVAAFVLILVGVFAFRVGVVPMCGMVMIEAGIAVLLHRAEIWVHGLLVVAELVAGVLVGRLGVIILCAVVYVAATAVLQVLGRGERNIK